MFGTKGFVIGGGKGPKLGLQGCLAYRLEGFVACSSAVEVQMGACPY